MKTPYPYIGITDFINFGQVEKMLEVFRKHANPGSLRRLHVGVMMSYKTLNNIDSKWNSIFPPKESIADIFRSNETINCIHYADYVGTDVYRSLSGAIEFGGDGMNALQLDMTWPDPNAVIDIKSLHKNINIILQIGKKAIEQANNNPEEIIRRIGTYKDSLSYVLLDKSMGQGVIMDADKLISLARETKDKFPDLGIVVAGGLGPETIHLIEPIIKEFPDISIDAQGKLRPSGSILNPIDWSMAEQYIIKALEIINKLENFKPI